MANSNLIGRPERCLCNKLLCTVKDKVVLIKCSRCKRFMVIETEGINAMRNHDLVTLDYDDQLAAIYQTAASEDPEE